MRSLFDAPWSSGRIWEFGYVLLACYLLFHPALAEPRSLPVALGGGLLLLLFRPVAPANTFPLGKTWSLFLAYLLASCLWSLSPGITLQSAGLVFLGTLLYAMAPAQDPEAQDRLETCGLILALLVSVLALRQWLFGFGELKPLLPQLSGGEHDILEAAIHNRRATGPLATPGGLAALLLLFIPQGLLRAKTAMGFKKGLFAALTLVMGLALLATQSVGACLCLTICALVLLLLRRSRAAFVAAVAGVATLILLIGIRGVQSWLLAAFSARWILWKSALAIFLSHPWFGTGLGTFDEAYQQAGLPLASGARFAHNLFLQILVETGVWGLVVFLAAFLGILSRIKTPSRWEGWGVLAGALAFFLFSFLDLPFQMPELIWLFAVLAGRLELRPEKPIQPPPLSLKCVEWFLLAVLLVSGFWPPFRPWNMALVACALWTVLAGMGRNLEKIPLWVGAGGLLILLRAFFSPSALGTVWFMETTGLVLAFWLIAGGLPSFESFFKRFCLLGLVWGAAAWFNSFQGIPFEAWANSTNPKHLAVFLIPLVFLFFPVFLPPKKQWLLSLAALATMVRLRATGALLGIAAGISFVPKLPRNAKITFLAVIALGAAAVRWIQPSSTQWDRWMIWKSSLQVWALHPLIGNGPGVFEDGFEKVKSPRGGGLSRYLMEAGYSHNEYLEFLAAFGLLGAVFLAALLFHWVRRAPKSNRPAIAGLGLSAFLDFCLHTPRVALQAVLLGPIPKGKSDGFSWTGGFLALGLSASLFGAAVFVPYLQKEAQDQETQGHFPLELRLLETAEKLNPWDARAAWPQTQMLEKLYLATGDKDWKTRADDSMARILELEPTQGKWYREKAGLLSERVQKEKNPESFAAAVDAWHQAEEALPFSAYLLYDEAMFYLWNGHPGEAGQCLGKAVKLEPHYAVAAAKLGLLLLEEGKKAEARQAFTQALQTYDAWQGKPVDEPEKPMLAIPQDVLAQMRKEVRL